MTNSQVFAGIFEPCMTVPVSTENWRRQSAHFQTRRSVGRPDVLSNAPAAAVASNAALRFTRRIFTNGAGANNPLKGLSLHRDSASEPSKHDSGPGT